MPKNIRRGFVPTDCRQFNRTNTDRLRRAQQDLIYLLNRGYPLPQCLTFIGNRFQLSARQRTALMRSSCSSANLANRTEKLRATPAGTLWIDGFNQIITLEAALSDSTLLYGMDGTVRDLCGLRGTYELIDKTDRAICLLLRQLRERGVDQAIFVLDRQVSNSGRLKQRILNLAAESNFSAEAVLSDHADSLLIDRPVVATSDSGILDRCNCWMNLLAPLIRQYLPAVQPINLSFGRRW
ncbi:MAG: DUF434 domain-containing protein [Sporolactobacillus sp.]|jgi:hypothetical protein|nr:DUF434 domain-containing protein [Sporolactobacillus sp.]